MQSKKEFVESKLPGLKKLLDEIEADSGIYGIGLMRSYYFEQPADKVVSYFEGLAAEGVTVDDFLETISRYISLGKVKPEHMDRVRAFISAFLDVCS